jgi:hypothetical protein
MLNKIKATMEAAPTMEPIAVHPVAVKWKKTSGGGVCIFD